ncbi:16S rRNA (uracil(1498)-N(3))-methyltransferase [Canibacter sp. lx-45]|uniref:16S rRNA (uracil(1498)-N(3))-methyltransferase n=1 Tax=Canibacter zhuwentaonis TaxID=2837491 RepID=UPI001BDD8E65|nr:16S rRNA (uracil(1498)-N(3))-methyltransferase [Canibacter zhuwentaonis]MBT1035059.1 16S rRNA (uracil(1498)-N(3))-methyltransferase [Canibacter zhuwentaonis]
MAHLYYDSGLIGAPIKPGKTLTLTGEEARHAVTVARLRAGEQVYLGDTDGRIATVQVTKVLPGKNPLFHAEVLSVRTVTKHPVELVLAQALVKGGRDEMAVQQSTEFGVNQILPWRAQRSVVQWQDCAKVDKMLTKWQKITREASKQSLRARVPKVHKLHSPKQLAQLAADEHTLVLVLDPWQNLRLSNELVGLGEAGLKHYSRIVFAIGPEGGITESELQLFADHGARAVTVGETVLRSASAAAAALAVCNLALGVW